MISSSWSAVGVFLGLAFGPLIGIPVAPFYVASGVVWKSTALFWVAMALAIDFTLAYIISGWIRPGLTRRLARFKFPSATEMGPWKLVIITRSIPGLPLAAQNYFLCLSRTPFFIYFVGSMIVQLLMALGFILAGHSIITGKWAGVATGIGLVLLFALLTRAYIRRK